MVVDMSTFREVIWPMVRINKYYVVSIGAWQFYAKPSDSFVKKSLIRLYSVYRWVCNKLARSEVMKFIRLCFSWITIIFWLSLYILTQFMELVRAWGDIVQMANCVFLFCTVIATLVKYMCLYDNNRTFRFVLKHIYSEDEFLPQSNRELSIVQDAVSLSIKLRTFYFLTCASSLLFIILYPIYLINDTGKSALPVAAYFPLDLQNKCKWFLFRFYFCFLPYVDASWHVYRWRHSFLVTFVLVYIYQSIGLSLQCMACVAIDSLFCGLLIVAGAQLNILQLRLAAMSDSNPNKKRHSIKQQLLHCVHHHQNIKRWKFILYNLLMHFNPFNYYDSSIIVSLRFCFFSFRFLFNCHIDMQISRENARSVWNIDREPVLNIGHCYLC